MRYTRLLIGTLVTVGLLAALWVSPASAQPGFNPPGLARAIEVQEYYTDDLLGIQGVVGTAVGLGADGEPEIKIYTERSGFAGLPRSLDGVPVVVQVTGEIVAFHHRPTHCDGPSGFTLDPSCFGPTADDVSETTSVNTDVDITLSGTDRDDCELDFIVSNPASGTLGFFTDQVCTSDPNTDTAQVTYTPVADFNGTDSFTYTVSAGGDTSDPATVTITVGTVIDPTQRFEPPVPIGVSSGNEESIATRGRFLICSGGTYGARVTDGADVFALSNNHVYAEENNASIGSNILQPGLLDTNCDPSGSNDIGPLFDFVPIVFSRRASNTVDAAIALSSANLIRNSTPTGGYGTPNSNVVSAFVNQEVQKYGRTTGLTTGTVTATNASIIVRYNSGQARFDGQIVFGPGSFSQPGDSGALIVTQSGNNPVALLFAGGDDVTFGNPISDVLSELGTELGGATLTIDGPQ